MRKEEIREALKFMDVATARGRRAAIGREIDLTPDEEECLSCAIIRSREYIDIAKELRKSVMNAHDGISAKELEAVELVMEQLEDLSEVAHKTALRNY